MKLRFRDKLVIAFAALLLITLLPVLVLVNTQIEFISAQKIKRDLQNTLLVFQRYQENRLEGYSERTTSFILTQPEVRAEIATSGEGPPAVAAPGAQDPFGAMRANNGAVGGPGGAARAPSAQDPFGAVATDPSGRAPAQPGAKPPPAAPRAQRLPGSPQQAVAATRRGGSSAVLLARPLPDQQNLLLSVVEDVKLYKESEIFFLVDPRGTLIFNKADPHLFGSSLSALPEVAAALQGQEIFTWWGSRHSGQVHLGLMPDTGTPRLYQVFLKPIVFGQEVRGLIGIGFPLTTAELGQIIGITQSEIAFLVEGQLYLNSLADIPSEVLQPLSADASRAPGADAAQFAYHGETFLALAAPMTSSLGTQVGSAIVYRSKTKEMLVYDRLRNILNLIGLAALLVAGVLAFAISRNVTRALSTLFAGVGEVQKGNLAYRLDLRSRDEFGEVGKAFNEMTAGLQEKEAIRNTFKRYVSSTVVDELLRNTDGIRLGGESKVLTIQFSDIAGFTNISENLPPQDVVEFLNTYLSDMTTMVEAEQGIVDKYIGDAVMAFWGAPLPLDNPALHGCRAALAQLRRSRELQERWADRGALSRFHIRIGLHTGEVVVGNIGSNTRMDYTIIGDSVNVASRLEGINKVYGTQIVVSEATMNPVRDEFVFRELDLIRVVGKQEPVRIFELVGRPAEVPPGLREAHARFAEGLQRYRGRDFVAALQRFEAVREFGHDPAADTFAARCRTYGAEPPPEGWGGVFDATSK